jgi:hypothetical protein
MPLLQHGAGVSRLPHIRPSLPALWRPVHPSDWKVICRPVRSASVEDESFERLAAAWASGDRPARARRFHGPIPYPGFDWGIRQPEHGETALCWTEVVCFLNHGIHEADE